MTINIINLDSLNGSTYNTSGQYNTYAFNTAYLNLSPNAFNANFKLKTPLFNIKKIYLKSIEIPIGFNNIRASSKTNIIAVSNSTNADGTYKSPYSISLPDKTYSNINTLITDINAAFLALYPTVNIIFAVNSSGYITVSSSTSLTFNLNILVIPTNLSYMLGFRNDSNIMITRLTTAPAVYMLNIDNYINMYISNLSTSHSHNQNGILCHFKIITNCINGTIYYVAENNSYEQCIEINSTIPITELNIVFTDRFGYSLNSSGLDYSCTFSFES
jgi:hypothetical protein